MYFFVHLMILFITLFKFFLSICIKTPDVKTRSNSFEFILQFSMLSLKEETIFFSKDKLDKLFCLFQQMIIFYLERIYYLFKISSNIDPHLRWYLYFYLLINCN